MNSTCKTTKIMSKISLITTSCPTSTPRASPTRIPSRQWLPLPKRQQRRRRRRRLHRSTKRRKRQRTSNHLVPSRQRGNLRAKAPWRLKLPRHQSWRRTQRRRTPLHRKRRPCLPFDMLLPPLQLWLLLLSPQFQHRTLRILLLRRVKQSHRCSLRRVSPRSHALRRVYFNPNLKSRIQT
jgi:hypothetical protein